MITFEFSGDTDEISGREIYCLGLTDVTGEDKAHSVEIYEQIDAQVSGLVDETKPLIEEGETVWEGKYE